MTDEKTEYNGIDESNTAYDDKMPVHPLAFDWAIYAHHLKESDLTGEQRRQLIETLWTIASLFVDYGFGVDPVTQVCGQDDDLAALIAEDMVCWDQHSEHEHDEKRSRAVGIDMAALPEGSPR